jgi:UDPglucose 6-dehydrogenase
VARIFIIGSGVVGTATGKGFAHHGHDVTFVDIDHDRLRALRDEGFTAVDTIRLPDAPAFVFLTLPTPNVGHHWDLTAFNAGTRAVGEAIGASDAFHTIVVRSTVPPGTCEGLVRKALESCSGRRVGEGFALASAPEFLRAASAVEDFLSPWMTVIGSRSRRTVERLEHLFQPYGGDVRTFTNPAAAELVKCAHNIFNATKISFWNEMWRVASLLHLDPDAVAGTVARSAEASLNLEYGIRGGAPYGGVCLPKDTKGFLGYAAEAGIDMPLLTAVVEVNDRMERLIEREMVELEHAPEGPVQPGPATDHRSPIDLTTADVGPGNGNGNGSVPSPPS